MGHRRRRRHVGAVGNGGRTELLWLCVLGKTMGSMCLCFFLAMRVICVKIRERVAKKGRAPFWVDGSPACRPWKCGRCRRCGSDCSRVDWCSREERIASYPACTSGPCRSATGKRAWHTRGRCILPRRRCPIGRLNTVPRFGGAAVASWGHTPPRHARETVVAVPPSRGQGPHKMGGRPKRRPKILVRNSGKSGTVWGGEDHPHFP